MTQAGASTIDFQSKLSQLADFLDKASKLARELSHTRLFTPRIPELTRPRDVSADEAWFWSPEWQAMEQDANAALGNGKYQVFDNASDLLADLHARA